MSDFGLLALGIALPCVVVGYVWMTDEQPRRAAETALEAPTASTNPSESRSPSAPTSVDLAALAMTLGSADAGLRAETVHTLSHLDNEARASIMTRLSELGPTRPAPAEIARIFAALRRASGANNPDDDLDLALAVVEPLLYLRSLETMVGAEGQSDLARFVDLDDGAWENELRLSRKRLGASFVPALIAFRSHDSQRVRRFAAAQLTLLGLGDPKVALSSTDSTVLARTVRAYASPPDYAAMPVIVRLVADARIQVRQAARDAVSRFGRNAVWQLRALYDEVSGQPADKRWDHERTARELYAVLDRPRLEEAETLLARGLQALTRGDLGAVRRDYDALLAKYPDFDRRDRLAEGYARIAADLFRHDSLAPALAAYRRALRLAPDAPTAKRWRAQVAFVSAELSLTRGVVDLTGYTHALELDPALGAARDALERLSGTRTQHVRDMKRLAALAAFALLLACVVLLLRRRPTDRLAGIAAEKALPEIESQPSR